MPATLEKGDVPNY